MNDVILSGPIFEPPQTKFWHSNFCKQGAHYNIYSTPDALGLEAVKGMFPDAVANEYNFCLFSTSGVHGTYCTIETAAEVMARGNKDEDGEPYDPSVTFLIVHPRIVCLRYGNCVPETMEDIKYLKRLRQSSFDVVSKIGV